MKNIHILKTDQPSRLIFNPSHKSFCIQKELNGMYINDGKVSGADFWGLEKALNNGFRPQHLYITNGEEIKKGDWYLFNNQVFLAGISTWEIKDRETSNCKKIILTTDQTLIEDGVQEIDDTFLQWFIENPTCEYVGVEKQMLCTNCGREHCDNLRCNGYEDKPYYEIIIPLEEPKQVICRDKFDRVIQDGCYVDVQKDGVHKVYRKEDGQLYFKPYGEEERVSNYFSNDLILIPYSTKLITYLKKEIADKKQEEPKQETLEEAKYNCEGCQGKGYLDKNDGYDYGKVVCPICINDEEPKQETLEEAAETTAIRFLEWYRRKGVIYQFHAYHIPGNDETIYLSAQQLFAIFKKENYE
jgi:hypothetical protein